jgi:hypothetical protein
MTLNINLSVEMEAKIRALATASGQDVEAFVLNALDEKLAVEDVADSAKSAESFEAWLQRWIALHPQVGHTVDDSRESIYEGRGE